MIVDYGHLLKFMLARHAIYLAREAGHPNLRSGTRCFDLPHLPQMRRPQ